MGSRRAVVIGAGMGGLAAAIDLARCGWAVTVLERAATPGGKMRELEVGGVRIDSGPTVLTLPAVFEELFADAGARLGDHVALQRLDILARHAWPDGSRLDLYADERRSADAIADFAGPDESRAYLRFCAEARRIYETLGGPFMASARPDSVSLALRVGPRRFADLIAIRPFETLWRALGAHFRDQRLRQLFGRYATYCGSSPFLAPATLMLIAHVEKMGVWSAAGGMQRLAEAMVALASRLGVAFEFGAHVARIETIGGRASGVVTAGGERVAADAVVCNAEASALAAGLFGEALRLAVPPTRRASRSLSALTFTLEGATEGFGLVRHNVFFSGDYVREFADLSVRLPADPTIYVCAADRLDDDCARASDRLLVLVNAPARGDEGAPSPEEIDACEKRVFAKLQALGLKVKPRAMTRTSPAMFAEMFPATGGALYGQATHGWRAAFERPGSTTRLPGLYLASGSVHPGPGAPMAALSGRLAAARINADFASTAPSRRAATPGGISTRKATTGSMA
jgi:1-hydroxycarotenoid 3,4-desaturase